MPELFLNEILVLVLGLGLFRREVWAVKGEGIQNQDTSYLSLSEPDLRGIE
jgi:hypothetical protein